MSTPKEHVVFPKQDLLAREGFTWIHELGGEGDLSLELLTQKYLNGSQQAFEEFTFIDQLVKLWCKRHNTSFWTNTCTLPYRVDCFLGGGINTQNLKIAVEEWVKFYGHLTSSYVDLELSLSLEDKLRYEERGLINSEGKSTSYFCQQLPFLMVQDAQKQLEGMQPLKALKLFCCVLEQIRRKVSHRSTPLTQSLLDILAQTIYIQEMMQSHSENSIFGEVQKKVASWLLNRDLHSHQKILIHSGHHMHTFYVGVEQQTTNENIDVRFYIGNFNRSACDRNARATEGENDFYPYIVSLKAERYEPGGKKKKVRKEFRQETLELAFYITFLHRSSMEGNHFVKKCSKKKLSGNQTKIFSRFKKILYENREKLFHYVKTKNLSQEGFFSLDFYLEHLETPEFNSFMLSLLPHHWMDKISNPDLYWHALQFVLTLTSLEVIHTPWEYGASLFKRNSALEKTCPSFPIQRIGNCTVYNLKMVLYPLAGLDWRNVTQVEGIKFLNIDIALQTVQLVKEIIPESSQKLPDVDSVPFPVPPGRAVMEIQRTNQLRAEGNLLEAEGVMLLACKKYEDDGYAFAVLGLIYDELHQNNNAIQYYSQALTLIDDPEVHANLAICYAAKGQHKEASEHFDFALDLNPHGCQIYFNRAQFRYGQNALDKALEDVDKLLQLEPSKPEHYLLRGQLLIDMKRITEGAHYVAKAHDMGLKSNELFFSMFKLNYEIFLHFSRLCQEKSAWLNEKKLSKNFEHMKSRYIDMVRIDGKHSNNAEALELLKKNQRILDAIVAQNRSYTPLLDIETKRKLTRRYSESRQLIRNKCDAKLNLTCSQ